MLFLTIFLATSAASARTIAEERDLRIEGRSLQVTVSQPSAFQDPSPLTPASNTLALTRTKSARGYNPRSAAWLLHNGPGSTPYTTTVLSGEVGEEFFTSITFGNFTFDTIIDTGSSDAWVVEAGFQCVNVTNDADLPEADCVFGPAYTVDNTFTQIPDENFNITYGSGEFLTGIVGHEQVTIAGLTVNQQVALVNLAAWEGDNVTSGLTGFAYPALTSAFQGTNPHNDSVQEIYNPLFTTLYTNGLIPPLFSLAILRDVSGPSGYLSLGGTPPIEVCSGYTSTPILVTHVEYYPVAYDFYTIQTDNTIVNGKDYPGGTYIVDSGTTLNYVPTPLAYAINNAFDPPATYAADEGVFIVDCNATSPSVGITIGGTLFNINSLDLILLAGTDPNICISGVMDGGNNATTNVYILGDTFQKNVVTVFDVGASELRFAAHENYPSNDQYKK